MSRKSDHADTPSQRRRPPGPGIVGPCVCLCGHGPAVHTIDGVMYAPCLACACPAWRAWQDDEARVVHRQASWRKAARLAGEGDDAA